MSDPINQSAKRTQRLAAWSLALFGVFIAFPDAESQGFFHFDSGGLIAGAVLIYVGYKISKGKNDGTDLAKGCMGIMVLGGLFSVAIAIIGFSHNGSGGHLNLKGHEFQPGEEWVAIPIISCVVAWAVGNFLLLRAWSRRSQTKIPAEKK
jgi:hypothetical protein